MHYASRTTFTQHQRDRHEKAVSVLKMLNKVFFQADHFWEVMRPIFILVMFKYAMLYFWVLKAQFEHYKELYSR